MQNLTTHLVKVQNVIFNTMHYGYRSSAELEELHQALTSTKLESPVFIDESDEDGVQFKLVRTRTLKNKDFIHGIRIVSINSSAEEKAAKANLQLAQLDTEYPEWLWAETPFWSARP